MKFQKILEKVGTAYFFIGIIVIGLLLGAAGLAGIFSKDEYLPCEATIVRIEEYYDYTTSDDDSGIQYRVYVDYAAEGRRFREAELGSYSSSMKEGDVITIEYKKGEPEVIQGKGAGKVPYIVAIVGFASAGFGIYRYSRYKKFKKETGIAAL